MKINDAETISDWMVDLRDGALVIQRAFHFESELAMGEFIVRVGEFMKTPGMTVLVTPSRAGLLAEVSIRVLPENRLLRAAGKLAAHFEYDYGLVCEELAQSAA